LKRLVPAPNRFIIGPDAINTLGRHVSVIGRRVFLIGGKTGELVLPYSVTSRKKAEN
jgi:hypothetical protein